MLSGTPLTRIKSLEEGCHHTYSQPAVNGHGGWGWGL